MTWIHFERMKIASFANLYEFEAFHKQNIAKGRIAKFSIYAAFENSL